MMTKTEFKPRISFSRDELKERLSKKSLHVTQRRWHQEKNGVYINNFANGIYNCVVCDTYLFSSKDKFKSNDLLLAFYKSSENVVELEPVTSKKKFEYWLSFIKPRQFQPEVKCENCGAHLGYIWPRYLYEGKKIAVAMKKYSINSAALNFVPDVNEIA